MITDLYLYPVKGLSGQRLESVRVGPGTGFPLDRAFAIARRTGPYTSAADGPLSTEAFHQALADPRLVGVATSYDASSGRFIVRVREHVVLDCDLDSPEGADDAMAFFAQVLDVEDGERPVLARATPEFNYAWLGSDDESLMWTCSLINVASVRDLEERIGRPVDPRRFRANLYVDLGEPWLERELIGRRLRIGDVVLEGVRPTIRCAITELNVDTGLRDMPVPRLLQQHFGHAEMGIYTRILTDGELRIGMPVELIGSAGSAGSAARD